MKGSKKSSASPGVTVEASVVDRLGEMLILNVGSTIEVGNGSRHFENAIVCAGGKAQSVHGILERLLATLVQTTVLSHPLGG